MIYLAISLGLKVFLKRLDELQHLKVNCTRRRAWFMKELLSIAQTGAEQQRILSWWRGTLQLKE